MHSILPALLTVLSFAGARAQPTESAVSLLPEIRAAGEFSLPCGCWNPCTIGDVAMGSFSNGTSHCDTTCAEEYKCPSQRTEVPLPTPLAKRGCWWIICCTFPGWDPEDKHVFECHIDI